MDHSRGTRRFWLWLAAISSVGLAIRVGFVLILQSRVTELPGDAGWYHFQAKLLAEGKGFLNPVLYYGTGAEIAGADHPPGLVVFLAMLELLGISSTQGQRLVLCVVGTATIPVIAHVGRRIASARVGLIAAALAAIYPNIWVNDGLLMPETIFILATAVSLLFAYRFLARPDWRELAGLSAALTVAAMVRPEAAALFVLLVAPLVLTRASLDWPSRIRQLAVAALIPVVAFAPWVIYNLGRFEEPVLLSSGLGQTLVAGNCDATYSGEMLGYWDFDCLEQLESTQDQFADVSVRDGVYRRAALEYMSENRGELPRVAAARIGRLWGVYRAPQSLVLDGWVEARSGGPEGTDLRIVREALWAYWTLGATAIGGLFLLVRRKVQVWPLLAQAVLISVVAAFTFGLTRYRAGFEVSIVLFASVALSWLYTRVGGPPDETVRGPIGGAEADEESLAVESSDVSS